MKDSEINTKKTQRTNVFLIIISLIFAAALFGLKFITGILFIVLAIKLLNKFIKTRREVKNLEELNEERLKQEIFNDQNLEVIIDI